MLFDDEPHGFVEATGRIELDDEGLGALLNRGFQALGDVLGGNWIDDVGNGEDMNGRSCLACQPMADEEAEEHEIEPSPRHRIASPRNSNAGPIFLSILALGP